MEKRDEFQVMSNTRPSCLAVVPAKASHLRKSTRRMCLIVCRRKTEDRARFLSPRFVVRIERRSNTCADLAVKALAVQQDVYMFRILSTGLIAQLGGWFGNLSTLTVKGERVKRDKEGSTFGEGSSKGCCPSNKYRRSTFAASNGYRYGIAAQ